MILKKRLDLWLPTYAATALQRFELRRKRKKQLTQIIFLVCDHFEPKHGITNPEQSFDRLQKWKKGFAEMQGECQQKWGTTPLHTWFYPPHHGNEHLAGLSEMVFEGLGETELHYHHDRDTEDSLRQNLKANIADYARWGLLLESGENPRRSFGFIHGDWALNNSRHGKYCGVNGETRLLQELGCWGDFTMPSVNECQTRKINSIYYAHSDSKHPKAHTWGTDARVGMRHESGMFFIQGPLAINWRAPGYPRIENASLTSANWGRPDRIRAWLDCAVHVKGKPDWLFVKLHTHGALEQDFDSLFGQKALEMHRVLNEQYNDGVRYKLHYASARQAFNIAKAAEAGLEGDPWQWRNFRIAQQCHSFYHINFQHDLVRCTNNHLTINNITRIGECRLQCRTGPIYGIEGNFEKVEIDIQKGLLLLVADTNAEIIVYTSTGITLNSEQGIAISNTGISQDKILWKIRAQNKEEFALKIQGLNAAAHRND
jgi:hypothetical protein